MVTVQDLEHGAGAVARGEGPPAGAEGSPKRMAGAPLTIRGVESRLGAPRGVVDYMALSVWSDSVRVRWALEREVADNYLAPHSGWVTKADHGPDGVWSIGDGAITVASGGRYRGYCHVDLKGDSGCGRVGLEGVQAVWRSMAGLQSRFQASRIDVAWDDVGVRPLEVFESLGRMECRTGSLEFDPKRHRRFFDNGDGSTGLYLGEGTDWKQRWVFYDRRQVQVGLPGSRFEVRFVSSGARLLCNALQRAPVSDWDRECRARVNLLEPGTMVGERFVRAKWFADFKAGAGDIVEKENLEKAEPSAAGRLGGWLQQNAKAVEALRRAYGLRWLEDQCRREAMKRWTAADDERVRQLVALKGTGLCGVPDAEVPF